MACPRCGRSGLVTIDMKVEGCRYLMSSCTRCEHRWWEGEGGPVPLAEVLRRVAA